MTMQIGDDKTYKGCLENWSKMMKDVTGVDKTLTMYPFGDDSISLPQCFWLRVLTEDEDLLPEETTMAGEETTMAENEATTAAGEEDDTTVADGGDGGNGGGSRARRWKADPVAVKVDHHTCITGYGEEDPSTATPCNKELPACLACPGGDLSDPDMDQFCQKVEQDYCFEEEKTCSGAAGVSFGVATTAATFIASRIFA